MTKITGSEKFNNREEALKFYDKLDEIGYAVTLKSEFRGAYVVGYTGYSIIVPEKNIHRM